MDLRVDHLLMCVGENNLSFIETSALDASNVELAFQNILTGKIHLSEAITFIFLTSFRNLPHRLKQSARRR